MPYLVLGGSQVAIGAAAIFARYALSGAPPLAVGAARLGVAALVLIVVAAVRRSSPPSVTTRQAMFLATAGIALAAHFGTWIASLDYTSVAISTLLVATSPVWTALYDAIVLGRPLTPPAVAAFVTGGAGTAAIVGFNRTAPPIGGHPALGACLALAGGIAIAAYFIVVREVRRELSTRTIVTHTYAWAAVTLGVAAVAAHQPLPAPNDTVAWGGILAMALVSQLLGHTALNASLRWFTPSAVSFATLIEPIVAAVLALLIFGERIAPLAIVGGAIVLVSIAVVLREEPTAIGKL
jgi:drug/metabolite transporter (DMT)-like permease